MKSHISAALNTVSKSLCMLPLLAFSTFVGADFKAGVVAAKQGDWLTASSEFKQAAQEGDPNAQTALCYLYSGKAPGLLIDSAKAIAWCQKAADRGLPEAEHRLGEIYVGNDFGMDVSENNELSAKWYRRAAERGYAPAQNNLGAQYFWGKGVARDYAKMIPWYRKAAEQGYAPAQTNLGASYFNGQGVPKNQVLGHAWTILAFAQNFPGARGNIQIERRILSPAQQKKAEQIAKELEVKIKAQRKPRSDLDNLYSGIWLHKDVCIPVRNQNNPFRIKMVTLILPDNRNWCYEDKKQSTNQSNPASYSFVSITSDQHRLSDQHRYRAFVNLTNIEDKEFANAKQLLKFAEKVNLAKISSFTDCQRCKYKYYIEETGGDMCISYRLRLKDRYGYGTLHGRLCVYPRIPSVLLTAGYHTITARKPRGDKKKEILVEAEKFLSSIQFKKN